MALRRRRVRTVVRNTTSSVTAPSLSIPPDYTGRGVTIWYERVAKCSKSGFTALLARGCDLGYWGFAPAPSRRASEPNSNSLIAPLALDLTTSATLENKESQSTTTGRVWLMFLSHLTGCDYGRVAGWCRTFGHLPLTPSGSGSLWRVTQTGRRVKMNHYPSSRSNDPRSVPDLHQLPISRNMSNSPTWLLGVPI